ncbi:MAG: RNA 2',3'-cyclic phosphodiesterase [Planctomycetota bacterium]|nr:RNA 2',3'-cyclic phosphodiesterase [Planctomycetota bacterium]
MPLRPSHSASHERVRAFIAVELDDDVKRALRPAMAKLQERHARADVRWVPESNWHLTVKFLGDVPWLEIGRIGTALQELAAETPAFELEVKGLGAFPPDRSPRIVAAGIGRGAEELAAFHARLEARMAALGYPPENRGFKAHLTLGRVRGRRGNEMLWENLAARGAQAFGESPVEKAVLYQSELESRGARYTALATGRFKLV